MKDCSECVSTVFIISRGEVLWVSGFLSLEAFSDFFVSTDFDLAPGHTSGKWELAQVLGALFLSSSIFFRAFGLMSGF